jgi:adenylate cyclase
MEPTLNAIPRLRKWVEQHESSIAATALTAACLALVMACHAFGLLQPVELLLYDATLKLRPATSIDSRVVLILETENDLKRFGHPLPDGVLAQMIERLAASGAKAIGVDKYRDIPVAPGTGTLAAALARHQQVVWIMKAPNEKGEGVLAPEALRGTSREGFNDLVADPDGSIRRGLVYLQDHDGNTYYAFPLLLAARFLGHTDPMITAAPEREDWVRLGKTTVPAIESWDGAYAGVDTSGYQYLLDYRGMPAKFQEFTLGDLLDGRVKPAALEGKMVIFGASAESLNDFFNSAFPWGDHPGTRLPGAVVQAHAASQLLRFALGESKPVSALSGKWGMVLIATWAIAGALLASRTRGILGFAAFSVLGILACLMFATIATSMGWWIPSATPALGFLLCGGAVAGERAVRESRHREAIMRIFSTHVSNEVADELWLERDTLLQHGRLTSKQLTATILFTDIRGFTPITEKLPVADLFQWLNEYMDAMTTAVGKHGGFVRQYIGDGVMAVFGAPIARTTREGLSRDATNAVRCALEMGTLLEQLNKGWALRGLPPIGIRAGINTGPMMSGSLGGASRLEYTLIGDAVNTASRLESFGGNELVTDVNCRVLIGEMTRDLIGDAFNVNYIGVITVKGKAVKLPVYQVLSVAEGKPEAAPAAA